MKSEEEYIKEFRALETAKIRTKLIDALSKDRDESKTCNQPALPLCCSSFPSSLQLLYLLPHYLPKSECGHL
jgi:hypothetical protein